MTVAEVICKIGRAKQKIIEMQVGVNPDIIRDELIDILEDYVDMLENLIVKK